MTLARSLEDLFADPERRAKTLQWLWVASLGMVGLGYLAIAWHYQGLLRGFP